MRASKATDELRAKAARGLRYKKPILEQLNYEAITSELWDIQSKCDELMYMEDVDRDAILDALDGDEDDAEEYRMTFADISADCERLISVMSDTDVEENFDIFLVTANGGFYRTVGYDSYEADYFLLSGYESEWARSEAAKRLMRLTKQEIIELARKVFGVIAAYTDLVQHYDKLEAVYNLVKGENAELLSAVKRIDEAYERYIETQNVSVYDDVLCRLPDRAWLE